MKFIVILLLLAAAFLTLRYFMPTFGTKVAQGITVKDGESLLADCPDIPNCQCSESTRQSQQVARFPVTKDPSQSIATLARIIEGMEGMDVVQFDAKYLYVTSTSSVLRFVDDIEFLLSDDEQSIQVRSASRLGKSDLGANAQRVDVLRTAAEGML